MKEKKKESITTYLKHVMKTHKKLSQVYYNWLEGTVIAIIKA